MDGGKRNTPLGDTLLNPWLCVIAVCLVLFATRARALAPAAASSPHWDTWKPPAAQAIVEAADEAGRKRHTGASTVAT